MSDIGNLMRSASNELNQYILAENERLAATVHGQMETPPDYHDQQTCYELQIKANAVDTLTARVAELETEAIEKDELIQALRGTIRFCAVTISDLDSKIEALEAKS